MILQNRYALYLNIAKQKSCIQLYESGTPVREIQKILNIGSSGTSAIKREGKKLYELARRGQEVERQPRPITIEALDLLDQVSPKMCIRDSSYTLRCKVAGRREEP